MIQATAFDTIVEVEISGSSTQEWAADFGRFTEAIHAADREFNRDRRVWIVRNLEDYADVNFIKNALANRGRQPDLFSQPTQRG